MKTRLAIVSIVLGLVCAACHRNASQPPTEMGAHAVQWLTDFSTAQAQARAQDKPLLINFTGSDWCPPCIMLHRQVFSQPAFADYAAKHLILLEVDFPHGKIQSEAQKVANEKLADRFGIDGFPTIVLLDSTGKKLGELGYQPGGPKPFITAIEKLRGADATSTPPG